MPDCHLLYKNKCFEFGMYLAACYDKDELVNLFYPLFRNDYEFLFGMNVEIENFESVVDTARNFGMDLDTFEERFQNVFNQSADEWFEKQRKHLIKQYVSTFP